MSIKLRRGLVAAATSLALATGGAVAAPAASAQVEASTGIGSSAVSGVIGIGLTLAFWGTVYNFLVNHGHVNGHVIAELPVF